MVHKDYSIIPEDFQFVLNYLFKAEGGIIHRNKTEADITNGYGIYRAAHPRARVWDNIDACAKSLGICGPSSSWCGKDIQAINKALNKEEDRFLSYLFYVDYYKPALLEELPRNCILYGISIYANGPKLYGRSVQIAVNEFIKAGHLKGDLLLVDGNLGPKSAAAVNAIKAMDSKKHEIFKSILLDVTKDQYVRLADSNPSKYGRYKRGWLHRVESLRNV